ncbi:hypothetical protein [endosymbiont GvMRE of Glomus versiforme]|uniref:hypothetical protein n=1 Tax=endosymbiont GvMRE of Glomus versiforme TaxID=2039283 RepID=UPI0011C35088|nr:hypothetical protein [endosymbiont GvMRE of Glomus versiforme]
MEKNNFESKPGLIEKISQQNSEQNKLIKKIVRQVRIFTKNNFDNLRQSLVKNPQSRLKIDWGWFEREIKEIINQQQKKQIQAIIDQFLEEIKLNLKEKRGVILHGYFSLKAKSKVIKKRCMEHQDAINSHQSSSCCNESKGIKDYAKCQKFKKNVQDIRNCNQCGSEQKQGSKKHISFHASPKLKKEIN